MGLGSIIGHTLGEDYSTPDVAKSNIAGGQLLSGMFAGAQQYQPQFAQLGLTTTGTLSPQMRAILRAYSPEAAGLLDELTRQAGSQLRTNGALDPAARRMVAQNYRGAAAARGFGYGPGEAAMEDFYQTQTQEQRRGENQALAGRVAGINQSYYGDPFARMLNYGGGSVMPDLSSIFGTTYNAQAAAQTANSNRWNVAANTMATWADNAAMGFIGGLGGGMGGGMV